AGRRVSYSFGRILLQPLDERRGGAAAAGDDENRVVAGDRPDRVGQLCAIERQRERLRLADAGADDDELLHAIDAAQELGGRALEGEQRGFRIGGFGAGTLVRAVARAFDEAELLDVARDRRLRRFVAALQQPPAELLLAVERFAIDQLEECALSAGLHAKNG